MRRFVADDDNDVEARFWRAGAEQMRVMEEIRQQSITAVLEHVPSDLLVWRICRAFLREVPPRPRRRRLSPEQELLCQRLIGKLDEAVAMGVPEDILGATCADAVRVGEVILDAHKNAYQQGYNAALIAHVAAVH